MFFLHGINGSGTGWVLGKGGVLSLLHIFIKRE
jgi:hypothetical protein